MLNGYYCFGVMYLAHNFVILNFWNLYTPAHVLSHGKRSKSQWSWKKLSIILQCCDLLLIWKSIFLCTFSLPEFLTLWLPLILCNLKFKCKQLYWEYPRGLIFRGRLKSPWSRRKRKHVLSPRQWKSLFTQDGRIRDGGIKFLKRVRSGVSSLIWLFRF